MNLNEKNLIGTIESCLKEHEVKLKDENNTAGFYLIEAEVKGSLAQDIKDTYAEEMDDFKIRLVDKKFGNKKKDQTYGLLIDKGLNYAYAFNKQLADIDVKEKKIVFKDLDDVIIDDIKIPAPIKINTNDRPNSGSNNNDVVFRYSIIGKKNEDKAEGKIIDINFDKPSMLDKIIAQQQQNKIAVRIDDKNPSSTFYRLDITYKTSTLKDFNKTYESELGLLERKLAYKLFGVGKTDNDYILLLEDNYARSNGTLRIAYAFNKKFAEYIPSLEKINFKDPKDLLVENVPEKEDRDSTIPEITRDRGRGRGGMGRGGGMTIKYAIVGKKEE